MKKNTQNRGYLSQIAQPLLPREPILRIRRDALHAEAQRPTAPVIEDRFEFVQSPLPPRSIRPSSGEFADITQQPPSSRLPVVPPEDSAVAAHAEEETVDASRSDATTVPAHLGEEVFSRLAKEVDEVKPSISSARRPPDETPRSIATPTVSKRVSDHPPSSVRPARPTAASAESLPLDTNAAGAVRVESSAEPQTTDSGAEERTLPNRNEGVKRAAEGRRVHIGTVEIRAVLPQPPAPPPPIPIRPAPEAIQPGRRSGADEPLGRGLAWSYGLVQG